LKSDTEADFNRRAHRTENNGDADRGNRAKSNSFAALVARKLVMESDTYQCKHGRTGLNTGRTKILSKIPIMRKRRSFLIAAFYWTTETRDPG
jgi:hypothetical protein